MDSISVGTISLVPGGSNGTITRVLSGTDTILQVYVGSSIVHLSIKGVDDSGTIYGAEYIIHDGMNVVTPSVVTVPSLGTSHGISYTLDNGYLTVTGNEGSWNTVVTIV